MTRYTVVWDRDVELALVNAWLNGDSKLRAILTEIANWVDTTLVDPANHEGYPRPELSGRMMNVPLSGSSARVSVTYQVLPEDRQVRVIQLMFR